MRLSRWTAIALSIYGTGLAAQSVTACDRGPGVPLGITQLRQCDGCIGGPFAGSPAVIERSPGSPFQAGDVIVAVNGNDLTTHDGSMAFMHPHPGIAVVQFLRPLNLESARRLFTTITINPTCDFASGTTVAADTGQALRSKFAMSEVDRWLFGMSLECTTACTLATAKDGSEYWKYQDYPTVARLLTFGNASSSLRVGDRIAEVNGVSMTTEEGVAMLRPEGRLALTIIRDGARISKSMQLSDPRRPPTLRTCSRPTWKLSVRNELKVPVNVYIATGHSHQFLRSVQPGSVDIPLAPPGDSVSGRWIARPDGDDSTVFAMGSAPFNLVRITDVCE